MNLSAATRERIVTICKKKIEAKGEKVGLSFYAFFANKNDNPEELMDVATWWIKDHELDHFVKATKVIELIEVQTT